MNFVTNVKKIFSFFNLDAELENQNSVYEEIRKGIVFKGTNLWILIFAIIIASVGLNMNSTAVIIGAMLISPLMGPINGMGYSIATHDLDLFRRSIKNFSFAIVASLIASTIYFKLSPISTAYSELLARTSPTIYDVIIALFGGFAGIVAISSKQKGNVLPGVAIATALMPPLCTAGYGLATGQFNFFFGAFYLFTINTIFIAIASVWISKILNFPIRSQIDEKKKKNIDRAINLLIVAILLPSIYFGYSLVKHEEFRNNANKYVDNVSNYDGKYLLKSKVDEKARKIVLVYAGTTLDDRQKEEIIKKSNDFNIQDANIIIEQGLSFSSIDEKNVEVFKLKEQIANLNTLLHKKEATVDSLQNQQKFGQILYNEIRTVYPQIKGFSYSESIIYFDTTSVSTKTSIILLAVENNLSAVDKTKIHNWFKQRLQKEEVKLFIENTKTIKNRN